MISVTLLNLIVLIIFSLSIFTWLFIYPKRKINHFALLMIFSCIPLLSVWRRGSYESGDFKDHVYFFISFYRSLEDGIWFPRWSGGFCGGYGYPHIQYFYHLPYYIASLFHFAFRLSFVASFKMLICTSFLGAAASMYLWLRSEWGEKQAFFGSVIYILSPYLLAGAHFRNTVGEGLGTFLVPLVLWCIKKLFDKQKIQWKYFYLITLLYILLILSHHVVPVLSLPLAMSYFFFKMWQSKKLEKKKIIFFLASLLFSFLITSYHWVPILLESKWILQEELRIIIFPLVSSYFYSPWRFGLLNQGHHGELTWTVGYVHWLIVFCSGCCLFLKKIPQKDKAWLKFLLGWFTFLFVFLLPITQPIWLIIPIINNFQFAIRLLFLINMIVAVLAAIVIKNITYLLKYKFNVSQSYFIIFFLVLVTCGTTILNWGQRTMIPDLNDEKLELLLPQWCDQVAIPHWLDEMTFKTLPKRNGNIEVISGKAEIHEISHKMELHQYQVSNPTIANLRENTTYFPGWEAYLDGKPISIEIDDPLFYGIMSVHIPAGVHTLTFIYEHTLTQILWIKISLIALLIWATVIVLITWREKHD